ncbi:hypothetical protein F5146DRAFT_1147315 [Armillaria mellea]|nr:hypothetical protein F5146DRAFT_1147315 [Armillaria mellea]
MSLRSEKAAKQANIMPQPLEPIPSPTDTPDTPADPTITGPQHVILLQEYPHHPSYDPNALFQPEDLFNFCNNSSQATPINPDSLLNVEPPTVTPATSPSFAPPWPFANMTCFRLMLWANNGYNQKSEAKVDKLINNVILSPHFNQDNLKDFHCHLENACMDTAAAAGENLLLQAFKETEVSIDVPSGDINVPSDDAGCTLEKVITTFIIFSDATHLAQFRNAKVWLIYLAFGNLSKYFCS